MTNSSISDQGQQQQGPILTNEQFSAYEDLLYMTDRMNTGNSLERINHALREALTDAAEFVEIPQIALLITSVINVAQEREAYLKAQQVPAPEPVAQPAPKKWARAASITNTLFFMLIVDAVGVCLMRLFWGQQHVMYVLAGILALAGVLFSRMLVHMRKVKV